MTLLRRTLHTCQKLVPAFDRGITILGYHLVGAGTESPIDLPLDIFERQMDELSRMADVSALDSALDRLDAGSPVQKPLVVLTFDDGYQNFYDVAWPVLLQHRFPVSLYVQVDFLANGREGPIRNVGSLPPLTWPQLRELAVSDLVTIGSHSCSHVDMRALNGNALGHELERSKSILEQELDLAIDSFCYPRGQWSARVERRVTEHYRTAVIRGGRTMRPGRFSLHRLERVPIRRDMPESLRQVVESSIWLEEWCASKIRHFLF